MERSKWENSSYLEFYPKNGKSPKKYLLSVGKHTIGSSLSSNIRIKDQNQNLAPVSCLIEVKDNGFATLENKDKHPLVLNGVKLKRLQMLKTGDIFTISGKEFHYINNLPTGGQDLDTFKRRQSVTPSFKTKAVSRIPLTAKSTIKRRSFMMAKNKCFSDLCHKKKARVAEWRSIKSPNILPGKTFSPSMPTNFTTDLSVSIRRSLFLKKKNYISSDSVSTVTSRLSEDLFEAESLTRGIKRRREGNGDSSVKTYKRRKHSEKGLVLNLSVSHDSDSSVSSKSRLLTNSYESASTSTRDKELWRTPETPISPLHDLTNVSSLKTKVKTPNRQKPKHDLMDISDVDDLLKTPELRRKSKNDITVTEDIKEIFKTPKAQNYTKNELTDVSGVKKISKTPDPQKSPKNYFSGVRGLEMIFKTPRIQNSPKNDLTDVTGLKKILKTPKTLKSPKNDLTDVRGIKKIFKTPNLQKSPKNDLTDVRGVKKILKTPKTQKSPKNDLTDVRGIKKILKTPKLQKSPENDLTDVRGLKKILKTPKPQKSPKNDLTDVRGVKKILKTPKLEKSPKNDLTDVRGVKKILKTPRLEKSPKNDLTDVRGVKKIFKTPKPQKSPKNDLTDVRGVKNILKTPKMGDSKNDLSDVQGVKKIIKTPKNQNNPKNDLTDVIEIKNIFKTPKCEKSPRNDFANISEIQEIFKTPNIQESLKNDLTNVEGVECVLKTQKSPNDDLTDVKEFTKRLKTSKKKSPKNDLTNIKGVKNVMRTPRTQKSSKNNLLDARGVKNFFATPKILKSPANDLTDVRGVKRIMRSPKSPLNDLSDVEGVKELMGALETDQSLNNSLEKVYTELFNSTDVHNSTGILDSGVVATSSLEKSPENLQVSQRGRRIRRKKFDDFLDTSKQKLFAGVQKGKTNSAQAAADGNSSNLINSEEAGMSPKLHGRRKKKTDELKKEDSHTDTKEEMVEKKNRRGRRKLDETTKKEEPVLQKRNLRSRKKNIGEENQETIKTPTRKRIGNGKSNKNTDGSDAKQSGIEAQKENCSLEYKKVTEISKKRNLRGRKKEVSLQCNETVESTVEKRSVRDRRKKPVEETSAETVEPPNDRSLRGQRKKNMDEQTLEALESSKKHSHTSAKCSTRKKTEDNKTSIKEGTCSEVNGLGERKPATRGRRKGEAVVPVVPEARKTTRNNKRRVESNEEYLNDSVGNDKRVKTAKINKKELKSVKENENGQRKYNTRRGGRK